MDGALWTDKERNLKREGGVVREGDMRGSTKIKQSSTLMVVHCTSHNRMRICKNTRWKTTHLALHGRYEETEGIEADGCARLSV